MKEQLDIIKEQVSVLTTAYSHLLGAGTHGEKTAAMSAYSEALGIITNAIAAVEELSAQKSKGKKVSEEEETETGEADDTEGKTTKSKK